MGAIHNSLRMLFCRDQLVAKKEKGATGHLRSSNSLLILAFVCLSSSLLYCVSPTDAAGHSFAAASSNSNNNVITVEQKTIPTSSPFVAAAASAAAAAALGGLDKGRGLLVTEVTSSRSTTSLPVKAQAVVKISTQTSIGNGEQVLSSKSPTSAPQLVTTVISLKPNTTHKATSSAVVALGSSTHKHSHKIISVSDKLHKFDLYIDPVCEQINKLTDKQMSKVFTQLKQFSQLSNNVLVKCFSDHGFNVDFQARTRDGLASFCSARTASNDSYKQFSACSAKSWPRSIDVEIDRVLKERLRKSKANAKAGLTSAEMSLIDDIVAHLHEEQVQEIANGLALGQHHLAAGSSTTAASAVSAATSGANVANSGNNSHKTIALKTGFATRRIKHTGGTSNKSKALVSSHPSNKLKHYSVKKVAKKIKTSKNSSTSKPKKYKLVRVIKRKKKPSTMTTLRPQVLKIDRIGAKTALTTPSPISTSRSIDIIRMVSSAPPPGPPMGSGSKVVSSAIVQPQVALPTLPPQPQPQPQTQTQPPTTPPPPTPVHGPTRNLAPKAIPQSRGPLATASAPVAPVETLLTDLRPVAASPPPPTTSSPVEFITRQPPTLPPAPPTPEPTRRILTSMGPIAMAASVPLKRHSLTILKDVSYVQPGARKVINRADSSGLTTTSLAVNGSDLSPPPVSKEVIEWLSRQRVQGSGHSLEFQNEVQSQRRELMMQRQMSAANQVRMANRLSGLLAREMFDGDLEERRFDSEISRHEHLRKQLPRRDMLWRRFEDIQHAFVGLRKRRRR